MGQCKDCKNWDRNKITKATFPNGFSYYYINTDNFRKDNILENILCNFGQCNSKKIILTEDGDSICQNILDHNDQKDCLIHNDTEAASYVLTGEDYGCINFEAKP